MKKGDHLDMKNRMESVQIEIEESFIQGKISLRSGDEYTRLGRTESAGFSRGSDQQWGMEVKKCG